VKRVGNNVILDNDTVWPLVEKDDEKGGLEWRLRYGNPSREDMLKAASIVSAYDNLINFFTQKRQREILGQLKRVEQEVPHEN
jgi:hypothetical protein